MMDNEEVTRLCDSLVKLTQAFAEMKTYHGVITIINKDGSTLEIQIVVNAIDGRPTALGELLKRVCFTDPEQQQVFHHHKPH